jgi:hypothetical protein
VNRAKRELERLKRIAKMRRRYATTCVSVTKSPSWKWTSLSGMMVSAVLSAESWRNPMDIASLLKIRGSEINTTL